MNQSGNNFIETSVPGQREVFKKAYGAKSGKGPHVFINFAAYHFSDETAKRFREVAERCYEDIRKIAEESGEVTDPQSWDVIPSSNQK